MRFVRFSIAWKSEESPMTELPSQFWVQKLGWTLLHFLWQGTVIAVVYALIRRLTRRSLSAPGRYALACLALAAMAVTPPITFLLIPQGGNLPAMPVIQWNIPASAWQWMLPLLSLRAVN